MLGNRPDYRVLFAVDIEKSAGRGALAQRDAIGVLTAALRQAVEEAGIPWAGCHRRDQGDGMLVVLGPGQPKAPLLAPVVPRLNLLLRTHNRTAAPGRAVRIRMAVHAGDVHLDDGTVAGTALEDLARLLDAPPVRGALAAAPDPVTVALAISEHVWAEVVRHDHADIDPATYKHFRFTVKETTGTGWVHLPGHLPDPSLAGLDSAQSPAPREPERAAARPEFTNIAQGNARVGQQFGRVGTIVGNVGFGAAAEPVDPEVVDTLRRALDELRRALGDAQAAGAIDEPTYEAADAELDAANSLLAVPQAGGRAKLVLALKRFKGLVDEIAGLAAKVATVIDTVRGR